MKNVCTRICGALAVVVWCAPLLSGQQLGQVLQQGLSALQKQQWIITGHVKTLRGEPASNARVRVHYAAEGLAENRLEADIQGKYSVTLELDALAFKTLTVTVSAEKDGFFPARETANFTRKGETYPIDLVLLPVQQDDTAFPLDQLLAALAPRFKAADPPDLKSNPAHQDFAQGVDLFFAQHDTAKSYTVLSAVAKKFPHCVECRTLLGLVELRAGGLASGQQELAQAALEKLSTSEEPRKVNALIILSVVRGWSGEYPKAAGLLTQALKLAPQDPVVLQELGRTLINQKNWDAADEYLQKAIKAGAPAEAHLLRCRAVFEAGDAAEADAEMRAYLGGRDIRSQPQPVRVLFTLVKSQLSLRAYGGTQTVVSETLEQLLHDQPDLAGMSPAPEQTPLAPLLQKTGLNVEAFFTGFQNATSHERIEEQQLAKGGKVKRSMEQKFHYLLLTAPYQDVMSLDEYRTNTAGAASGPVGLSDGFMLTAGFASASLVFHPAYQAGAKFRLVGSSAEGGVNCALVAFAQDPQKAKTFGRFTSNASTALVLHQGIAWINPADGRIMRLRTDLLKPLPQVRLIRETTEIHYAQVQFKDVPAPVSLPAQVTVTVEWKGKTFRNLHQYTDFRLFNTSAHEKRQARAPAPSTNAPPH